MDGEPFQHYSPDIESDRRHGPDPPLHDDTEKMEWPNLSDISSYIEYSSWKRRHIPSVLTMIPDDVGAADKLKEIIRWSTMTGADWASQLDRTRSRNSDAEHENEPQPNIVQQSIDMSIHAQLDVCPRSDSLQHVDSRSIHSHASLVRDPDVISTTASTGSDRIARKFKLLQKLRQRPVAQAKRAPTPTPPPVHVFECISCFEELPETDLTLLASCRHYYCKLCLTTLITMAMAAEASFPPKCCLSPIPLQVVLLSLTDAQREEYKVKSAEYAILPTERWYCPNTACLKWIPPSKLKTKRGSDYRCPHCREDMCRTCRGSAHAVGTECPQDFGLEATLEIAEVEGWQRCFRCHAMVEHTRGCRHMTCRCKAEFCYVCSARWPTCRCTEADADAKRANVQRRREERAAAAAAAADMEAEEVARAIAEVQQIEAREAEQRLLEEERAAREEEELLAQLEQQRLQEEEARRLAAEQAEQDWLEAIRASFEEDFCQMQAALEKVVDFQKAALNSQHELELAAVYNGVQKQKEAEAKLATMVERNAQKYEDRRQKLSVGHQEELNALARGEEEEEDDMFVQVQVRLRGKPNKEARMARMLEELKKQQEENRQEMQQKQQKVMDELNYREHIDMEGLQRIQRDHKRGEARLLEQQKRALGLCIGSDRHWFSLVQARRLTMLSRHREIAMHELMMKEQPNGLLDWQAALCEPLVLGVDDGAPKSSRTGDYRCVVGQLSDDHDLPCVDRLKMSGALLPEITCTSTPASSSYLHNLPNGEYGDRVRGLDMPGSFPSEDIDSSAGGATVPARYAPPLPPLSTESQNRSPDLHPDMISLRKSITNESNSSVMVPEITSASHTSTVVTMSAELATAFGKSDATLRKGSLAATVVSVQSQGSQSVSSSKKSKWSFTKKSKDLTPEEIRAKMRNSVGDAF